MTDRHDEATSRFASFANAPKRGDKTELQMLKYAEYVMKSYTRMTGIVHVITKT
jgi:hypothetical protein